MVSPSTTSVTVTDEFGAGPDDVVGCSAQPVGVRTIVARAITRALFTSASLWHDGDTMIEFTERATEILRRSQEAARRFNPDAWIRVFSRGGSVQFALAEGPQPNDQVIENEGFRVAVEGGLEGIVAVREPHDQLFLRPAGSSPVQGEVIDAAGH
jgi:hypothetical protein